MQYTSLGNTDIQVSRICQGCWSIVGGFNWGPQDREDSIQAIRSSLEEGVTFFDTAPTYGSGRSESLLAEALGSQRSKVVIATKISRDQLAPEDLRRCCEESLRRLKRDTIDLLQLHWPHPEIPVSESIGQMEKLRQEGKVRVLGVSNFGKGFFRQALSAGPVVSNQVAYSLLFRAAEFDVQPLCKENDVSILCYSPILQGLLAGKFQSPDEVPEDRARTRHFSSGRSQARHSEAGQEELTFETLDRIGRICNDAGVSMAQAALAWLLSRENVAAVLAGARNAAQARDNAAAAETTLAPDVCQALSDATEELKDAMGPSIDMWQSDSRSERN